MLDLGLCFELQKEWVSSAAWYKTAQQYGNSRASKNLKVVSKYIPKSQSGNLNLMVNKIHSSISKEKKSEIVFKPNFENPIKKIGLENGFIYWGEIKNGIPHGYGKKKLGKSTTYQGEFVMGLEHGYGTSLEKMVKSHFRASGKKDFLLYPKRNL
jgi:hypothetical protein